LNAQITVEIAYALPEKQLIKTLEVPLGTTAQQAVGASGIAQAFDGLIPEDSQLGIFGKVVANNQILREGDRIEIYRSLIADPKVVRKERAAKARRARSEKKA
jgi:putative ubiquitin-RnfH superfamily antitoxin RatB of RatAB toxin-antitoxin module